MFQRSDLVRVFRNATFATVAEAQAFVEQAPECSAAEVAKLVPVVLELGAKSTPQAHRNRCEAFAGMARKCAGPELFVPCLRALKVGDSTLTSTLVALLPVVNDVGAHGELCDLLASAEPTVRAAGAEVLKHVGGRTALEILTKRAMEPSFPGRLDAMNALLGRAGQHGLPLVAAVIRAGRPLEKIQALRILADPNRFRDREPVVQVASLAAEDRDDLVLAQAITTLGQLDAEKFWSLFELRVEGRGAEVLRAFLVQAVRRPGPTSAAYLRDRFREGPKAARLLVIEAIESAGGDAFFPDLVEALSHRDVGIRTRAAHALTQLSQSDKIDAARAIVWLLRGRDVNVRRLAAEIATRIQDRDGQLAPRLLKSLRDEDWWVRERVLDALVEMNAPVITKHLVKDYLADSSPVVRRFAVSALMRIADPRALGALVRVAQQDEDWFVAELAVEAVGRLGDSRATAYLVDLLAKRPELRLVAIDALSRLKAGEACPDVAELLQDTEADVRESAIKFLDELDDGTHALWVKGCENDTSALVRGAAAKLLKRYDLQSEAEAATPNDPRSLELLLTQTIGRKADDLFLMAGRQAFIKRLGRVEPLAGAPYSARQIRALVEVHLTEAQRGELAKGREVDFSYELPGSGVRFRVNVFDQVRGLSAVFRTVKNRTVGMAELGLPDIIASFAEYPNGLVLVGGPTGAGKSTTLAALVDHINNRSSKHVITIEDPIEVVHQHAKCLINQRELGPHTRSFGAALRSALRQDPDVILVGELRDLETIAFAVSAAETGHLVLGTVHTTSADATIDRLINAFPPRQQAQIRGMLAESLRAVTCQYLLRTPENTRIPAVEVMIANEAISTMIRKGKTFQIPTIIATSRDQGMRMMDVDLVRLAKAGKVDVDEAYAKSVDKRAFEAALGLANPDAPQNSIHPPAQSARVPAGGAVSQKPPNIGRSSGG
ncbi:MAG: PilT/PilU family type 4a pilus ATPase [Polyangiaceae bacterium]|nr:PilT/PilU family type 4a pilus ATPase [Polyangiaceae bacterium]